MLNVYLVVCVKKCSFALILRVRKCKLSILSCVEKCNDLIVSTCMVEKFLRKQILPAFFLVSCPKFWLISHDFFVFFIYNV